MENLLDLRLKIVGTRPSQKERLQEDQSQALMEVSEPAATLYVLLRASLAPETQPGTVHMCCPQHLIQIRKITHREYSFKASGALHDAAI